MSFLKKIFGKQTDAKAESAKYGLLEVKGIDRLTPNSVRISFHVPEDLVKNYHFIPGQYVNISLDIDGVEYNRSYSLCSVPNAPLAIGVKEVEQGKVSSYLNSKLQVGDTLKVDFPMGNFQLKSLSGNFVGFAAGSGITPILSMAKSVVDEGNGSFSLFYGNRTQEQTMFKSALDQLNSSERFQLHYVYSGEMVDGAEMGRLNKEFIQNVLKADLKLLKAEGFFLCGPEEMIVQAIAALKLFGVAEDKIHFELFTAPVIMESITTSEFSKFDGVSKVTAILDGEEYTFDLEVKKERILDELDVMGVDAPYSCRGGVCCTCRAKVLEGKATMDNNMVLTDKEVADGYILTCQAHPASERLIISFDE